MQSRERGIQKPPIKPSGRKTANDFLQIKELKEKRAQLNAEAVAKGTKSANVGRGGS